MADGTPAATTTPTARPQACIRPQIPPQDTGLTSNSPVLVLAGGLDNPDDILLNGNGILVGEHGSGTISYVDGPGGPSRLPVVVPGVEGLAIVAGTLYAADQANDRIVAVNGRTLTTVLQLTPVAGQEGVDGIAGSTTQLLVPDSAQGRLLVVNLDGMTARTISGFKRPTGAWPMPDGSILVADENAAAVYSVDPAGHITTLAGGLPVADDVIADGHGRILAVSVADRTLVEVRAGRAPVLAAGFQQPQGLAVDGAGNALVADLGSGRLVAVVLSFKLARGMTFPALAPGRPICLEMARAPGYAAYVTIAPGAGYTVLSQPGLGTRAEVVPVQCPYSRCTLQLTATSGDRSDTIWLPYSSLPAS